jgi:hypothetical protein
MVLIELRKPTLTIDEVNSMVWVCVTIMVVINVDIASFTFWLFCSCIDFVMDTR